MDANPAASALRTTGPRLLVHAVVGAGPVWSDPPEESSTPQSVALDSLGLTPRLMDALRDWATFFTEIDGDVSAPEVAEEFVSQGFKVAHKLRGELKGSTVHLIHPQTGERVEIVRRVPR